MVTDLTGLLMAASDVYAGFAAKPAKELARKLAFLASSLSEWQSTPDPAPPPARVFLRQALAAVDRHPATASIPGDPAALPWQEGKAGVPESFRGRYMFCTLVGPESQVVADDFLFGLYLQAPQTVYPRHCHAAEEYYAVLSGHAAWEKNRDGFVTQPPGSCIQHESNQWHAMRTAGEPLLALWAWTGELSNDSYRLVEAE